MKQSLRFFLLMISVLPAGSDPLFAQSDYSHPTCGTFLYADLEARQDHLSEKERRLFSQLQEATRLELDTSIVSGNGHFRIHFDKTGRRAPSQRDDNGNGVPDYIDSVDYYMEFAWHVEIEEYGYIAPPEDNPQSGSGGIDGKIDVYVTELDSSVYGFTYPDPDARLGTNLLHGHILLDNDYKGFPAPGIDGLRITTAHEFHHVVQFACYHYDYSQAALYEATSTWMEYALHPDVNDYISYFNVLLANPQSYAFSTHDVGDQITGYAHMHYLQTLSQGLGRNIVKSIWDEFKKNGKSFDAINDALLKTGSGRNLTNSFCTFAHWSYYTGLIATDTPFFAKGDKYHTITPVQVRRMPEEGETGFVGSLMPLSFGVWRLTIPGPNGINPDVIDFLITNARSNLGAGGFRWLSDPETFTLDISATPRENYLSVRYGTNELYYRLTAPHQDFCLETIINGSNGVVAVAHPTPQPFYNDGADRMVFAVDPGPGTAITGIILTIYSISMTRVIEVSRNKLETLENLDGIIWDGRDERGEPAPSGVYIYTLSINGGEPSIGKFAVVKR